MKKIIEMAEGVQGFEIDKAQDLFFSMLSFSPRNSYYLSVQDKYEHLMDTYKELPPLVALALSYYTCKTLGRRLAPNLVMTDVLYRSEEGNLRQLAKYVLEQCFTRPDFITTSVQYVMDTANKKSIKHVPSYMKKAYKRCLQNMDDVTLKKQKLEKNDITVADLIKAFRPNPNKSRLKNLTYVDFIERNKNTKLTNTEDEKVVSLNATISNDKITSEEKKKVITKNIKNFGATDIIRNLSNIECTDENKSLIEDTLRKTINSKNGLIKLNPFDLIIENYENVHQDFINILDRIIIEWTKNQCSLEQEYTILLDMSGSMWQQNGINGAKFLSLIINCINKYNVLAYNERIVEHHSTKVKQIIDENKHSPNKLFKILSEYISENAHNGTWTRTSTMKAVKMYPNSNILLITDEFSYDDVDSAESLQECVKNNLIVFNCEWSGASAFSITERMLRISGFQAQILNAINSLENFDNFVQNIVLELLDNFSNKK